MSAVSGHVKSNPYYGKNHLGQVRCTLCDTVHRDDANFLVHIDSKRHQANMKALERAKEKAREEEEEREKLRRLNMEKEHEENQARLGAIGQTAGSINKDISNTDVTSSSMQTKTTGMLSRQRKPTIGKPEISFRTEPITELNQCRVWFDLHYPNVDESCRPLHRWMSSREQTMYPVDDSVKYLLFACDPYETVAYTFPNRPHTDRDSRDPSRFSAGWDPVTKIYRLFFVIG